MPADGTGALELGLTPAQLASFNADGYLVIPSFLSAEETASLLATAHELLATFDVSTHPLTKFTTGDADSADDGDDKDSDGDGKTSAQHVGDAYFLTSHDTIRFFFEPAAFDGATGALTVPPALAINKLGHALHARSPPFARATQRHPRTAAVARSLGFADPRVLQSMVICKQPAIGAAVPPHLDAEFLYTDPPSAVGFWIALEDAGRENAALAFWRGSHRRSPVRRRFVRRGADPTAGTEFVPWTGRGLPLDLQAQYDAGGGGGGGDGGGGGEKYTPSDADMQLVEVPAGGLVLIHGNVLHASRKNTSDRSRFAYAFHLIEGGRGTVYDERNWLQPPEGGFTRLYAPAGDA